MKLLVKKQRFSVLILCWTMALSGNVIADEKFSMEDKLQQCETAFKKAHSGKISQSGAHEARIEHRKLMLEILENLNVRNTEISTKSGEVISNDEIVNNFKVMGRLLEMLAVIHEPSNVVFPGIEEGSD